jgi:glutathione synthase/RimK-type ligase-like ATP-grasp enzyme
MHKVAYLTGRSYRGRALAPGQVPELENISYELITAAGAAQGVSFEVAFWDDPALPQRGYDLALLRTTWDYHERPQQFLDQLSAFEAAGLPVFNTPEVVRWNFRKTYLKELGPSAIETVWVDKVEPHVVAQAFDTLDATEIVLKPQVGAGSIDTVRLKRNAWSDVDLLGAPRGAAMIQPYLSAIETEGERSLFWFGDVYSHSIRKVPANGDWRANIPGQTRFVAEAPPAAAMAAAESVRARSPKDLLYVRIDLVLGDDGQWRVIEIEAIEPYLFLDFAPEGARALVGAIAKVLG